MNVRIRTAIVKAGLKHYEVADELNITAEHFSKLLRHELSAKKTKEILAAIDRLKKKE